MKIKIGVLSRAMASIRRYPDAHDQGAWQGGRNFYKPFATRKGRRHDPVPPCGTTLCLAGWIAFNEAPEGSTIRTNMVTLPDGTEVSIRDFAAEAAGLSLEHSNALFMSMSATPGMLQRGIDVLALNPDASYRTVWDAVNDPA